LRDYAAQEKSAATRAAYASDFRDWTVWCLARRAVPMPGQPAMIAAYLSHLASSGVKSSTIGRRAAALAYHHRMAGIDPLPTTHEGVRAVLRGIRRAVGTAPDRKSPIIAEVLTDMLKHVPASMIGIRDRAPLTLLRDRDAAFRTVRARGGRSVRDARRPSREDQTLEDRSDGRGAGDRGAAWLPVASGWSRPSRHGLPRRSGYVASAVEVNAPLLKIAEQTRHRSLDMLRVYSRRADLFREHSGAAFL
jgi:hypothetical protein